MKDNYILKEFVATFASGLWKLRKKGHFIYLVRMMNAGGTRERNEFF